MTSLAQALSLASLLTTTSGFPLRSATNHQSCIDLRGGNAANGAAVQLRACDACDGQNWLFSEDGTIRSGADFCVDIPAADYTPGTPLQVWECNGGGNQRWIFNADGRIMSLAAPVCIERLYDSTTDGTHLVIWPCDKTHAGQVWTL